MVNSSTSFARAWLLAPEPSRWLEIWWIGLHSLLALTVLMLNLPIAVAGLGWAAVLVHFRLRRPGASQLLVVSAGQRFALPLQGRFDLPLSPATRIGSFWVEIAFGDRRGSRFLILKDQLPEPDWRRLCLTLREGR